MTSFIKVLAKPCNPQGLFEKQTKAIEFYLNIDMIAVINSNIIYLKSADLLKLGSNYYTEFRLAEGEKFPI